MSNKIKKPSEETRTEGSPEPTGWTQPAIIWWNDTDQRLPDSDMTVMIHCPIADDPVWLGYHDGENWRAIDGELIEDDLVDNWAMMPDPPKIPFHASQVESNAEALRPNQNDNQ